MRSILRSVTVLALIAVAAPAFAATPAPELSAAEIQSRQSFQSAEAHFKAGRFAEALPAYQAGYDLVPLPGFLINIAQCYRRLGDLVRARATYRKFILVAPDSPFVPEVKSLIAELDQLAIDLEDEKKTVAAGDNEVMPPNAIDPETTAGAPGPALVAVPSAPAASSTSSPDRRWWLWGVVGAGVALAATTTFLLLRTPDSITVRDGTLATLRR